MSSRRAGVRLAAAAALAAVGTVACSGSAGTVKVDAPAGQVQACNTFAWYGASAEPVSLEEQEMRAAVMKALAAKGYKESADNPDCRISYGLVPSQKSRGAGPSVGIGAGGGSGGFGGGIGLSLPIGQDNDGRLSLEVIDARTNAQVWSGSLDGALPVDKPSASQISTAVARILAKYPDRSSD